MELGSLNSFKSPCDTPAQGLIGLIEYSYQQVAIFFGSRSPKNSEVKACLAQSNLGMGDRPGSSSRMRTSEDKVCRKDWCWSVRTVYVLESSQM